MTLIIDNLATIIDKGLYLSNKKCERKTDFKNSKSGVKANFYSSSGTAHTHKTARLKADMLKLVIHEVSKHTRRPCLYTN